MSGRPAWNPVLPISVYMADGEPHVFGERVYLFGSHDTPGGESFCLEDYEFFSAPLDDLSHWTSKGINYTAKQDPLYGENARYLFAPDVVRGKDGRYYLYYCLAGWKGKGGYSHPSAWRSATVRMENMITTAWCKTRTARPIRASCALTRRS